MNKSELQQSLLKHYTNFISTVDLLPAQEIHVSRHGKWSPARQLDHLVRSVAPVRMAFYLHSFLLKMFFGTANRPSRTYDELVAKYHNKLSAGGKASGRFIPQEKPVSVKQASQRLHSLIQSLCKKIGAYSEEELDKLILPHPLLGKLTLREMLYFTIYHAQHHQKQVQVNNSTQQVFQ